MRAADLIARCRIPFAVVACAAAVRCELHAQVTITALNVATTENFNSIGTSSTASLPSGWRMTAAGDSSVSWGDATNVTTLTAAASSGSPTAGGRYNWGQSATDRSIGFMTSSGYASPNSILADVRNSTAFTIDSVTLSFDYERYRINSAAASVAFQYSTDGTNWTSATAGDSGAFSTNASSYGFTTPVSTTSRTVTLTSLNLASGSDVYFRWNFNTTGANSQGIGLDNFSITASTSAIPEPSTYAAIVGAVALGFVAVRRRRRAGKATASASAPSPGAWS